MNIIETLGTYVVFPVPEHIIATPIENHKWLMLDSSNNTYWFDFTTEAEVFSGTKYKNIESVRNAFNDYVRLLDKEDLNKLNIVK